MDNQRFCDVTATIEALRERNDIIITAVAVTGLIIVSLLRIYITTGAC